MSNSQLVFPARSHGSTAESPSSTWTVLPSGRVGIGVRAADETIVALLRELDPVVVDQEVIEVFDVEPTIAELEVQRPFHDILRWQALAAAHGWTLWWQPQLTRDGGVWSVLAERVW
jgi:hypothetical protein